MRRIYIESDSSFKPRKMAWDSKSATARRRGNSTASRNLPLHIRQQSKQVPLQAKSAHVSDPFLQEFLNPAFEPADYLNASLPALQLSGPGSSSLSSSSRSGQPAVPLADLSTEAQTLLSQLNAHTTRLTNTLTQLTDDILRSGSRLAYEVELLRGETLGLAETLTDGLKDDVEQFVPEGIDGASERRADGAEPQVQAAVAASQAEADGGKDGEEGAAAAAASATPNEPPYISQLRTLTVVRSRLDSVIKTFGDAMEFVFPPSELSTSSSFLSVSAPDAGGENQSTEEKGQQILQKLRDEISDLLSRPSDPVKGIEDAAKRIEELKELSVIWKGTAEEKGRARFVENLARLVEERHRVLMREMDQSSRRGGNRDGESIARKETGTPDPVGADNRGYGGYGLISQLQKIRSGL